MTRHSMQSTRVYIDELLRLAVKRMANESSSTKRNVRVDWIYNGHEGSFNKALNTREFSTFRQRAQRHYPDMLRWPPDYSVSMHRPLNDGTDECVAGATPVSISQHESQQIKNQRRLYAGVTALVDESALVKIQASHTLSSMCNTSLTFFDEELGEIDWYSSDALVAVEGEATERTISLPEDRIKEEEFILEELWHEAHDHLAMLIQGHVLVQFSEKVGPVGNHHRKHAYSVGELIQYLKVQEEAHPRLDQFHHLSKSLQALQVSSDGHMLIMPITFEFQYRHNNYLRLRRQITPEAQRKFESRLSDWPVIDCTQVPALQYDCELTDGYEPPEYESELPMVVTGPHQQALTDYCRAMTSETGLKSKVLYIDVVQLQSGSGSKHKDTHLGQVLADHCFRQGAGSDKVFCDYLLWIITGEAQHFADFFASHYKDQHRSFRVIINRWSQVPMLTGAAKTLVDTLLAKAKLIIAERSQGNVARLASTCNWTGETIQRREVQGLTDEAIRSMIHQTRKQFHFFDERYLPALSSMIVAIESSSAVRSLVADPIVLRRYIQQSLSLRGERILSLQESCDCALGARLLVLNADTVDEHAATLKSLVRSSDYEVSRLEYLAFLYVHHDGNEPLANMEFTQCLYGKERAKFSASIECIGATHRLHHSSTGQERLVFINDIWREYLFARYVANAVQRLYGTDESLRLTPSFLRSVASKRAGDLKSMMESLARSGKLSSSLGMIQALLKDDADALHGFNSEISVLIANNDEASNNARSNYSVV